MNQDADADSGKDDYLTRARQLLDEGMLEQCLVELKNQWLKKCDQPNTVRLFSSLMTEVGRGELARRTYLLADILDERAVNNSDDKDKFGTALFETGYGLIDIRQHALAIMVLKRCLEVVPHEPTVSYELAFACMSMSHYEEAIELLKEAADDAEDFDTTLNLLVCYTLTRKIEDAKKSLELLEKLAGSEEEKKEVTHRKAVQQRLQAMASRTTLSVRDWLYVLYGSALLQTKAATDDGYEDVKSIASMIVLLKGLLEGIDAGIEAVEYYSVNSKPLAQILGELMEVPCDSYKGPDRPDRALLVMAWASDIIGPHQAFVANTPNRSVFAFGLSPSEPLPITPDIVGRMSNEIVMPWDDTVRKDSVEAVASRILTSARMMESEPDMVQQVEKLIEYYEGRRSSMAFNNSRTFSERAEYTAEARCDDSK